MSEQSLSSRVFATVRTMDPASMDALLVELQSDDQPDADALISYVKGGRVFLEGAYAEAIGHFERSLGGFQESGNAEGINVSYAMLGIIYVHTSRFAEGYEVLNRALDLARERNDQPRIAWGYQTIGTVLQDVGEFERALEQNSKAREIFEKINDGMGVSHLLYQRSMILVSLGRLDEALSTAIESVRHPSTKENPILQEHSKINLAYIYGNVGDLDKVDEVLAEIDPSQVMEFRSSITLRALIAEQQARRGHFDEARAEYTALIAEVQKAGVPDLEVSMMGILRELAHKEGDIDGYVKLTNDIQKINNEIRGAATSRQMAIHEAEKELTAEREAAQRHKDLLYGTLPQEIADRMIRGEDVSGDEYDHASVMFLDVVGFTSNSDELGARVVTKILDDVFETFDKLCEEHHVTKVKTIGDAYLAVAFPLDEGLSPEQRTAELSLAIQDTKLTWPTGSPLQYRIGLHSGPVVAGVIGKQRLQYDVWGDTVNVASRMESSGEAGRVQVSETFATSIPHPVTSADSPLHKGERVIRTVERGEIDIKGKGTMKTFWLESETLST